MFASTKKHAAALFSAALLLTAVGVPSASAQQQDGLINVMIGDITIEDVNVGVAANIAAQVCGINVGGVAVLAVRVDQTGVQRTVCTVGDQTVRLTQN
jgi:hypothetical protein